MVYQTGCSQCHDKSIWNYLTTLWKSRKRIKGSWTLTSLTAMAVLLLLLSPCGWWEQPLRGGGGAQPPSFGEPSLSCRRHLGNMMAMKTLMAMKPLMARMVFITIGDNDDVDYFDAVPDDQRRKDCVGDSFNDFHHQSSNDCVVDSFNDFHHQGSKWQRSPPSLAQ